MPDTYYPDVREPHIHIHRGGTTYTALGHSHKYLERGSFVYKNVCKDLHKELSEGDDRDQLIAAWIENEYL